MKAETLILVLSFCTTAISNLASQTFIQPNIGLKSHETLEINKIEISAGKTMVFLTVENRIESGYFCADKNIFIIYPDGTRSKLISSSGIPVCPDTHKFKAVGEKLDFILTFPPLKAGIRSIDIIENCSDNCFSFYGIILDNDLNKMIDDAFVLIANGESAKALAIFINLVERSENKNPGVLYINIIKLAKEAGNTSKAAEWYNKLKYSGFSGVDLYLKHLNSQGINY